MATRARVLTAFKELHRTCQSVYAGHRGALRAGRWKINSEFKRYKDEPSPKKIEDHIQFARDASRLVRLTAVAGTSEREERYPSDMGGYQRMSSSWQSERRPHKNFHKYNSYSNGASRGYRDRYDAGNWRKGYDSDSWDDDYPQHHHSYQKQKPWHKKKPRHVDSSNFDLSMMTGKRRR